MEPVKQKKKNIAAKASKLTPTIFSSYYHFITHFVPNWEEPVDINNPRHQMALHLAVHEMAEGLSDRAVRSQIQSIAKKSVAELAQKLGG